MIVVGLAVVLFGVMIGNLIGLGRLLLLYLRDRHVAVDVMLETSIPLFVIALGLLLRFGDLRVGRE